MAFTAKQAFATRLVEAMRDVGHHSTRNAKSGIDVGPLAKAAGVSREMARRYAAGKAIPDLNKMQRIATWLGVRLPWLRDGEGDKRAAAKPAEVRQVEAEPYLNDDAREIAQVWSNLPPERRQWFRDLMCLEAVVSKHYPWLMFGRPGSESYKDYEERVQHDLIRLTARLTMKDRR